MTGVVIGRVIGVMPLKRHILSSMVVILWGALVAKKSVLWAELAMNRVVGNLYRVVRQHSAVIAVRVMSTGRRNQPRSGEHNGPSP